MHKKIQERAQEILRHMSLKEKIGQLNQEPMNYENTEDLKAKIRKGELGSIILATSAIAGNDQQKQAAIHAINELERVALEESPSGIPLIFGRDVIHGHRTVLPIPLALAATFNPDVVYEGYCCVAKEAAAEGIQWTFSPMMDISRDPRWGRCVESCGEDPYLTSQMTKAVISGFQDENMAACAKHYIGYGAQEGGRDYGVCDISDYSIRNVYLPPFKTAVESGVATVMNAFHTMAGETTSSSRYLVNDLLKEELGFDGFVISDWASIEQLVWQRMAKDKKQAAEIAINTGVDMDMVDNCYAPYLEELVEEGKVSVETIDLAVLRILSVKLAFGLFENPYVRELDIDFEAHDRLAENCSDEAIILLKNKDHILPLDKECKAVLAGPMLHEKRSLCGTWTLDGDMERVSTLAEEIEKIGSQVMMAKSPYPWEECLAFAYTIPAEAYIVALGESYQMTGEANSLSNIDLPQEQLEYVKKLHKKGKPVIGVLLFGRPIGLEEIEPYLDAIVYAWHSGTRTAQSVAKLLFGDVNPSGKLPMTLPRSTGQVPIYYNGITGRCNMSYYGKENMQVHGYRDSLTTPMYPFGYGLSYTSFSYSDLSVEKKVLHLDELKKGEKFRIRAKVTNTGKVVGKETSQCYICDLLSTVARPERELKGFVKQEYAPGETKEICFELGWEELAFYHLNKEFKVEAGEFEIYVGTNCYAEDKVVIEVI